MAIPRLIGVLAYSEKLSLKPSFSGNDEFSNTLRIAIVLLVPHVATYLSLRFFSSKVLYGITAANLSRFLLFACPFSFPTDTGYFITFPLAARSPTGHAPTLYILAPDFGGGPRARLRSCSPDGYLSADPLRI